MHTSMYYCLPAYTALDRRVIYSNICQIFIIILLHCGEKIACHCYIFHSTQVSLLFRDGATKSPTPLGIKLLPCLRRSTDGLQQVGRNIIILSPNSPQSLLLPSLPVFNPPDRVNCVRARHALCALVARRTILSPHLQLPSRLHAAACPRHRHHRAHVQRTATLVKPNPPLLPPIPPERASTCSSL